MRELRHGGLRITQEGAEVRGGNLRKREDTNEEESSEEEEARKVYGAGQRELVEKVIKEEETKRERDGELEALEAAKEAELATEFGLEAPTEVVMADGAE